MLSKLFLIRPSAADSESDSQYANYGTVTYLRWHAKGTEI